MKTYNEMAESALKKIEAHQRLKTKRRKTAALCVPVFAVLIVALASISLKTEEPPTPPKPAVEIDITAQLAAKRESAVQVVSGNLSLATPYKTDEEKLKVENISVIYGKVTDTNYVLLGSTVFTKAEVEIRQSFKGELQTGDTVYVKELGGFVPSNVLSNAINTEKFSAAEKTENEAAELLDIRVADFKVMEKGEEVILFLLPVGETADEEFDGCYELLRLWQGKLLYNEMYDAFIPYCPSWDLAVNNKADDDASIKIKSTGENPDGAQVRAYTLEEFTAFVRQSE